MNKKNNISVEGTVLMSFYKGPLIMCFYPKEIREKSLNNQNKEKK